MWWEIKVLLVDDDFKCWYDLKVILDFVGESIIDCDGVFFEGIVDVYESGCFICVVLGEVKSLEVVIEKLV